MRAPIAAVNDPYAGALILCDDGAVYRPTRDREGGHELITGWEELPPIPGSARDDELPKAAEE